MAKDPVILFYCLLALMCQVFVVVLVGARISAYLSAGGKKFLTTIKANIGPIAIPFAFFVALVTMSGSLYLSEVKHYSPCHLCWIQRGLLYPQFIFMGLLWWKPNLAWVRLIWVRRVAFTFLIACMPVSIYHYVLEWYPSLESSVCDPKNPCTLVYVRELGYISTPLMALTSALTVFSLLLLSKSLPTNSLPTKSREKSKPHGKTSSS